MSGHVALTVASAASRAASDAIVDPSTVAIWTGITLVAGAIGAAAVFTKNILEIRKLKSDAARREAEDRELRLRQQKMELEIAKLREDAQERDAMKAAKAAASLQILIASQTELVKYGVPSQVEIEWPAPYRPVAARRRTAVRRAGMGAAAGLAACVALVGYALFDRDPRTQIDPVNQGSVVTASAPAPPQPPSGSDRPGARGYAVETDQMLREQSQGALQPSGPIRSNQLAQVDAGASRKLGPKGDRIAVAKAGSSADAGIVVIAKASASDPSEKAAKIAAAEAAAAWRANSIAMAKADADAAAAAAKPTRQEPPAEPTDAASVFRKGYEAYLAGRVPEGIRMMERADSMGAPGARARLCAIYRKPTAAEGKDFLKEFNKCQAVAPANNSESAAGGSEEKR